MERRERSPFTLHGKALRTRNDEQGPDGPIARAWQEAIAAGLLDRARALGTEVAAAYTRYESDATGAYTFVLGIVAPPGTRPAPGEQAFEVPAGPVVRFRAAGPAEVPACWGAIWAAPVERAFTIDTERYGADGSVAIDVAVR